MRGCCAQCNFSRRRQQGQQLMLLWVFEPPRLMPVPNPNGGITFQSMQPPVADDEDCGKFEPDPMARKQ